jgi:hypothetical protein
MGGRAKRAKERGAVEGTPFSDRFKFSVMRLNFEREFVSRSGRIPSNPPAEIPSSSMRLSELSC